MTVRRPGVARPTRRARKGDATKNDPLPVWSWFRCGVRLLRLVLVHPSSTTSTGGWSDSPSRLPTTRSVRPPPK
jgi:hypothetical protein